MTAEYHHLTRELEVRVREMFENGKNISQIAREIGYSRVTVQKWIKKWRLKTGKLKPLGHMPRKGLPPIVARYDRLAAQGIPKEVAEANDKNIELCLEWDRCEICLLSPGKRKQLKDMYYAGFSPPLIAVYHKIPFRALAGHALRKKWDRKMANDPERIATERDTLLDEVYHIIAESEASGTPADKIAALKLAAQLQEVGSFRAEKENTPQRVFTPGVLVKMKLTLNNTGQTRNTLEEGEENSEMLEITAGELKGGKENEI